MLLRSTGPRASSAVLRPLIVGAVLMGCAGSREPAPHDVTESAGPGEDAAPACEPEWSHLPVVIGFATRGAELDWNARDVILEVVRTLAARDGVARVRVEGYTDRCGLEGEDPVALSRARALAVREELVRLTREREIRPTSSETPRDPSDLLESVPDPTSPGRRPPALRRRVRRSLDGESGRPPPFGATSEPPGARRGRARHSSQRARRTDPRGCDAREPRAADRANQPLPG